MYLERRFLAIFGAATIAAAAHCHAVPLESTIDGRMPGSPPTSHDIGAVVAPTRIAASLAGGTGGDRSFIVVADLRPRKNFGVNRTLLSAFSCLAALGLMLYPHAKQRAGR